MIGGAEHEERLRVLELDHISLIGRMRGSLLALAGDLVLLQVASLDQAEVWSDVALGFEPPGQGRVKFLGNDWSALDPELSQKLRSQVGSVFARGNWIEHLSLFDNVLLPAAHHTSRDVDELRGEAAALATAFGIPGIPLGMSKVVSSSDRRRAACVRAFLNNPRLVLLEDPTYSMPELLAPLVNVTRTARSRGAAVVWLTTERSIWEDVSIPATRRYRVAGREIMEVGGH